MSVTITPSEAAESLDVSTDDLAFWRAVGLGPQFVEIGNLAVRYLKESVDDWDRGPELQGIETHCPTCSCSAVHSV